MTADWHTLLAAARLRLVAEYQPRLEAHLRRIFSDTVTHAAVQLERSRVAAGEHAPQLPQFTIPPAGEVYNDLHTQAALGKALHSIYAAVARAYIHDVGYELGLSFNVRNELAEGVLAQHGTQIVNVSDSQRRVIMRLLNDAWTEGLSIPDAARLVRQRGLIDSAARARAISRTELTSVTNASGLHLAMLTESFAYKVWTTAPGAQYPRHDEDDSVNGQTVPTSSPFDIHGVQAMYPGDPNLPAEDAVNCRCLAPWQSVSGCSVVATMRRAYEGDLVRVVTASGHELTATPNHPVLTPHGWQALGLIREGDDLVRRACGQRAASGEPDKGDVPAEVHQLRSALVLAGAQPQRVPSADFHGESLIDERQVEVIRLDDVLTLDPEPALGEHLSHLALALAEREMRAAGNPSALLGVTEAQQRRIAPAAPVDAMLGQYHADRAAGDAQRGADLLSAFASEVPLGDVISEWRASGAPAARTRVAERPSATALTQPGVDSHRRDAVLACDLLVRHAGVVERDPVVYREILPFRGHVYNLATLEGAYFADCILAANCTLTYSDSAGLAG